MLADGKENLHPNSPRIHDPTVANSDTKSKPTVLGSNSTINQTNASRPLLFSEILFNNTIGGNGHQHFSTSCTSPSTDSSPLPSLDLSFSEPFEMNGLFNASFNAPTANVFGAIGTQAPLLSSSSSTTSTNSDPMDTLLWLGAIGNALPSSTSSLASYSPPSTDEFSSATMPYIAENQGFGNVCGNCEGPTPENLCFDCSDSLCNRCVLHHLSHFPYKHHTIQKITKTSSPMVGRLASNFAPSSPPRTKIDSDNQCDMHYEVMRYVCEHCKIIVCQECTFRDHKDHQCTSIDKYVERPQTTIKILMDKGASGKQQIKQSIDRILQFTQHMERDANEIIQRTRKNGMRHNLGGNGLRKEEQDRALADIIEKFRQQKLSNFHDKTSGLRAALAGIATVTDDLKKLLNKLDDLSQFQMAKTLIESDHKIEHFLKQTRKLSPSPVNVNHFVQSIDINGSGGIGGVGSAEESIVAGLQRMMQPNVGLNMSAMTPLSATSNPLGLLSNNNSSKAIRRPITRNNRSYHNNNQQNLMQSSAFNALPGISNWSTNLLPNNDLITFPEAMHFNTSPPRFGMAVNRVNGDEPRAFGQCIFNSEAPVAAVQRLKPSHSFAYDGSLEGQLSRPWGVCVDKAGNIIIGDRRNNRIQIFYPDGTFKFAFGTKGSGDGQLELPAGVTTDRQNRIIVADKDNHRIQIFSSAGRFILKFGSYGRDLGEFQYPWDVAVNSIGNIIATDTRNHRIQMFTSNGHFITKYSFDSAYYEKHLKSHITPRGLAFTPSGDILVTDFENHRIMKLDGNLTMVKLVRGREGEGELHEFNRPSGLCCDDNGRVVVADSKNQRVLVYNTNIELQWVLDVRRTLPTLNNEKDRPSDVAILPDGRIVVLFETSPDTKDCPHPMKTFVQIY